MDEQQVLALVVDLVRRDVRVWVAGGWGVDALVGRRTRAHRDLDLVLDAERFDEVVEDLLASGFVAETDWRPVRLELVHPDGRIVDVHPLALAANGSGVQAGLDGTSFTYPVDAFARGTVAGCDVPCLSVAQQVRFHTGYDHRPQDLHDLALLRPLDPDGSSRTP